jgi:ribosome-associated protein
MNRRAAPHRGIDAHYGDAVDGRRSPEQDAAQGAVARLQKLGAGAGRAERGSLDRTGMPETLRDALHEYRRTKSHEGRRRQMQYIGKLMRGADEAPLREAVAAAELGSATQALQLHEIERWRAELIADDEAMTRWLQAHPDTDAQQLRSLVRAARRDTAALKVEAAAAQPKSVRELFQYIKPYLT